MSQSTNAKCFVDFCAPPSISGSRFGGKEESRAREDQKQKEEIQTENPGEHSEAENWTTEKETDEEKTDEKEGSGSSSSTGYSLKTCCLCHHVYTIGFICVQ